MKRRGFLKSIGKTVGGLALGLGASKAENTEAVKEVEKILAPGDRLTLRAFECINHPVHEFYVPFSLFRDEKRMRHIFTVEYTFVNSEHEQIPELRKWLDEVESLINAKINEIA